MEPHAYIEIALKTGALLVAILVVCGAGGPARRYLTSRRRVNIAFTVVGALIFLEYYIAGSRSFITWNDEAAFTNPFFNYITHQRTPDQVFAHEFAGGNDLYAMFLTGMQILSLEYLLFKLLPHWVAVLAAKVFYYALAVAGAYRLSRRTVGASRETSVLLALLYYLGNPFNTDSALAAGTAWFAPPLVLYLVIWRSFHARYWGGVVLSGLFVMASSPTNVATAALVSIPAGVVLFSRWDFHCLSRIFGATGLLILGIVANWHEVLFAMHAVAPYSHRGLIALSANIDFWGAVTKNFAGSLTLLQQAFCFATLVGLLLLRDPLWRRVASAFGLTYALAVTARLLPWELVGLAAAKGISWDHAMSSLAALMLPGAARVLYEFPRRFGSARWPIALLPTSAIMVSLCTFLIWMKTSHLIDYARNGGQAYFHHVTNLVSAAWIPQEAFRVVRFPHFPALQIPDSNSLAGFYGLDTFDGIWSLIPRKITAYWGTFVLGSAGTSPPAYPGVPFDRRYIDPTDQTYALDRQVSLSSLAVANVGFVVSVTRLSGSDIRLVSGPCDGRPVRVRPSTVAGLIAEGWEWLLAAGEPREACIYQVPRYLPRAFSGTAISVLPDELSVSDRLQMLESVLQERAVFVPAGETAKLPGSVGPIGIGAVTKIQDGYDIEISRADQPGIVVLNVPYGPFWRAYVDGNEVPVADVNMVHMATAVPVGAGTVQFRYTRPRLRGVIVSWMNSSFRVMDRGVN